MPLQTLNGKPLMEAFINRTPNTPYRPTTPRPPFSGAPRPAARPSAPRSQMPPKSENEHRVNDEITAHRIRLIDENGEPVGIVSVNEALRLAEDAGLDLVEIASTAVPPVCKILNYSKFRYEEQKKKAEARKNQKVIVIKEIKLRPNIDDNDFQLKVRNIKRFLADGDKVKIVLQFRGRELSYKELGMRIIERVREDIEPICRIESQPKMEGAKVIMIVAPKA
jgi:translation initiation factor IF-3